MTLLIVDDEELTRLGVIASIDWEVLGITDIIQADDGLHGLETARACRPDIILSDVRMPRMDGITMLKNLEADLPDTSVIFMSGYSEKQYLKAAIRLKAVSYVEKPVQTAELEDAIREAIRLRQSRLQSHRGRQLQSIETKAELAQMLTVPIGTELEAVQALASSLSLELNENTFFTAIIIHVANAIEITNHFQEPIYNGLQAFISSLGLNCLYVTRRVQYLIFEIIGESPLPESILHAVLSYLRSQYEGKSSFYITAGETVQGILNAFHSYNSAVSLMQNVFFFPSGTILTINDYISDAMPEAPSDDLFDQALSQRNHEGAEEFLNRLRLHYECSFLSLPDLARDRYYRLFILIENARNRYQLTADAKNETILSSMEKCFSYQELHNSLVSETEKYFSDLEEGLPRSENSAIQLIKNYIEENYMKEGLSVKDISSHVFLSASYVCTIFKNETGSTLSQYITEFRMEKAKQLLSDPRFRISDISSRVGYNDGNYFGKSFKKYTGMTPSEYRERTTG